MGKKY
jgi:hypothetical protein